MPIVDELVLSDCDSDDGTRSRMDDWKAMHGDKINICNFPWTNPSHTNLWWPEWLNYARQHAKSDWIIQLDADEVLHEDSFDEVLAAARDRKALVCYRYNFWRDAQHLIPKGHCCGTDVIRIGPQNLIMPSDYPIPGSGEIERMAVPSGVKIMHYGFLRKREAFFKKARVVQGIWAGTFDPRLEEAEKAGGNWMEHAGVTGWENSLDEFKGTHPVAIHEWLLKRGYTL